MQVLKEVPELGKRHAAEPPRPELVSDWLEAAVVWSDSGLARARLEAAQKPSSPTSFYQRFHPVFARPTATSSRKLLPGVPGTDAHLIYVTSLEYLFQIRVALVAD